MLKSRTKIATQTASLYIPGMKLPEGQIPPWILSYIFPEESVEEEEPGEEYNMFEENTIVLHAYEEENDENDEKDEAREDCLEYDVAKEAGEDNRYWEREEWEDNDRYEGGE